VILPSVALTVIPLLGAVSVLPPAGVIDSRTLGTPPWDGAPALAWLIADLWPHEQAAASRLKVAQIAARASRSRLGGDDPTQVASGTASGRKLRPPDSSLTGYAARARTTNSSRAERRDGSRQRPASRSRETAEPISFAKASVFTKSIWGAAVSLRGDNATTATIQ
jgi:hypothetical protein